MAVHGERLSKLETEEGAQGGSLHGYLSLRCSYYLEPPWTKPGSMVALDAHQQYYVYRQPPGACYA